MVPQTLTNAGSKGLCALCDIIVQLRSVSVDTKLAPELETLNHVTVCVYVTHSDRKIKLPVLSSSVFTHTYKLQHTVYSSLQTSDNPLKI